MNAPLMSFVVSVYNLERYISQCLDSIIAQPINDYEIVLVNNNSDDKSDTICREYASRYKQIRYYSLDGEPIAGRASIYGLKKARGEYIQYIDGDDMLAPDIYGEIADILRGNAPDVLFGRFSTLLESDIINFTDTPYQLACINGQDKDKALAYLAKTQPLILSMWRLIVSRKLKTQFAQTTDRAKAPTNHQDVYISVRTLIAARSLHYVDMPIYLYRVRSSSISRISVSKQVSQCCAVLFALGRLIKHAPKTEYERGFISVYMEQFCYQLAAALCTLDGEQMSECAAEINVFLGKSETSAAVCGNSLIDILLSDGAAKGLAKYRACCMGEIKQISSEVLAKQGEVYLAPTGNIGVYIKSAFEANGLPISGFFDNDKQKDGMIAEGIPIRLPNAVTEMTGDAPITILIASRYANVREELKRQFISLGIDESNLITIDFQHI